MKSGMNSGQFSTGETPMTNIRISSFPVFSIPCEPLLQQTLMSPGR